MRRAPKQRADQAVREERDTAEGSGAGRYAPCADHALGPARMHGRAFAVRCSGHVHVHATAGSKEQRAGNAAARRQRRNGERFLPSLHTRGGPPDYGEHGEGGGEGGGRAGWREGHTNPHTQGGGGHSQEVQFPHAHTHTHTHPRQKTFVSANREKEEHGEHGEGGREGGTHTHTHTLSPHERGASRGSTGREGGREGVGREGRTHARARARARTRTHTQTHTKHRVRDPFPTYTHTPHTHIQAGTRTHIQAG